MNFKGMPGLHGGNHMPQQGYVPNQQIVIAALEQIDGEEVSTASMPGASVVGHGGSIATINMRRNALRLSTSSGQAYWRPTGCGLRALTFRANVPPACGWSLLSRLTVTEAQRDQRNDKRIERYPFGLGLGDKLSVQ